DYVYSFYAMAKLHEKQGDAARARQAKQATIAAWETVGRPTGGAAADMAAEFDFELAEAAYEKEFTPYKPGQARTEREARRTLDGLDGVSNRARDRFIALGRYGSGPWGMAALVRLGDTFFFQGIKITEIPIPKEIEELDAKHPEKEI